MLLNCCVEDVDLPPFSLACPAQTGVFSPEGGTQASKVPSSYIRPAGGAVPLAGYRSMSDILRWKNNIVLFSFLAGQTFYREDKGRFVRIYTACLFYKITLENTVITSEG